MSTTPIHPTRGSLISTAKLRPLIERWIEEADRDVDAEEGRPGGGLELLSHRIAASGLFSKATISRRLYAILHGQEHVHYTTVDSILSAMSAMDEWHHNPDLADVYDEAAA